MIEEQNFASSLADFTALAIESAKRRTLMRRTETLMSNLPGMVYQCLNTPPNFTFTFVSEGSYMLTGYKSEELMNNNAIKFFDMVHPDDVGPLERLNAETLSIGRPLETTFRMIMKDGSVKWIWERSRVVEKNPDGTPHLLEGFLHRHYGAAASGSCGAGKPRKIRVFGQHEPRNPYTHKRYFGNDRSGYPQFSEGIRPWLLG
jgi:PAS domain S-box-containing protein